MTADDESSSLLPQVVDGNTSNSNNNNSKKKKIISIESTADGDITTVEERIINNTNKTTDADASGSDSIAAFKNHLRDSWDEVTLDLEDEHHDTIDGLDEDTVVANTTSPRRMLATTTATTTTTTFSFDDDYYYSTPTKPLCAVFGILHFGRRSHP